MKKTWMGRAIIPLFAVLTLSSCLTTNIAREVPPPWTPEMSASAAAAIQQPVNEIVPVHWLDQAPEIDGDFGEWQGLEGVKTQMAVFGSYHDPEDAEGEFRLATDGTELFVYANVTDDLVNPNVLPGALAWRGDSVEVFFGTDTSRHVGYRSTDNQIRIVPRNPEDPFDFELAINDVSRVDYTRAAVIFNDHGYTIEAAIPLKLMKIDSLRPGEKVRCEFQVNDADETERDRLLHWMSPKDNPWFDASVWGNGRVGEGE